MAYATVDNVFSAYNPIKTMVGTAEQDVATLTIASFYIANAEGFMNAFLGRRYTVPVATEPLITMLTCDIAIFKLLQDRAPRIPEFAQRRYDYALDILKQLAMGDMVLTADSTSILPGGDQEAWSNVLSTPPVFPTAEMEVYSGSVRSYNNSGLW